MPSHACSCSCADASALMPLCSCLCAHSSTHASALMPLCSCLCAHASVLIPLGSSLWPYASGLMPLPSRLCSHAPLSSCQHDASALKRLCSCVLARATRLVSLCSPFWSLCWGLANLPVQIPAVSETQCQRVRPHT